MEDTTIIYKISEKRRLWVSIILSILKPGLPMIYCGRLWQGIIAEIAVNFAFLLMGILLALIPNFLMVIRIIIIAIGMFIGFLVYNIKLTKRTNLMKIPRLRRTWTLIILVGLFSWVADEGVSLLIKTQFVEAYRMPSTSMENTLFVGDYLMATKDINLGEIQSGDIIVFKYPGDPRQGYSGKGTNYIKRIIATGGQTIKIMNKQVFVDGEPYDEPPTVKIDSNRILPHYRDRYQWGPYNRDNMPEKTVPEGMLFVMGDNRDNSSDSRFWGYVNAGDVIGKARFIHFSWDSENNRIRWERLGERLDN